MIVSRTRTQAGQVAFLSYAYTSQSGRAQAASIAVSSCVRKPANGRRWKLDFRTKHHLAWRPKYTRRECDQLSSTSNEVEICCYRCARSQPRDNRAIHTLRKRIRLSKATKALYTDAGRRDPQDDVFKNETRTKCCHRPSERLGFHPRIQD